jgi:hypothetical protein
VVNRWNKPAEAVEVTALNAFKNILAKIKKTRMGFFMDGSSPKPEGRAETVSGWFGATAPGE